MIKLIKYPGILLTQLISIAAFSSANAADVEVVLDKRSIRWSIECPSGYRLYEPQLLRHQTAPRLVKYTAVIITYEVTYKSGSGGKVQSFVHRTTSTPSGSGIITTDSFRMSLGETRRIGHRIQRRHPDIDSYGLMVFSNGESVKNQNNNRATVQLDSSDFLCVRNW